MNRLHLNFQVEDIEQARRLYAALLGTEPTFEKPDYIKWDLDDPALSLSVTSRGNGVGLDHAGIKFGEAGDYEAAAARLEALGEPLRDQKNATCCYAESDKGWWKDPTGLSWELFVTHRQVDEFGGSTVTQGSSEDSSGRVACC